MSKALELIRTLIDGANEYEKKTGNTNPTVYLSKNNLLIIEKALLKVQEPKQYLKWEDLEFKKEEQTMKVLLNGERYLVKYVNEWFCGWCNMVQITNGTYILCTLGNGMKQFFNDLHLEKVEE